MKQVLLLGASGSIGNSTLDIIRRYPNEFQLCGASTHQNREMLSAIGQEFHLENLALSHEVHSKNSSFRYKGKEGVIALIEEAKPDIVLNGIAGSAGLLFSYEVLKRGIDLALANKESLVMAGALIKAEAKKKNCQLLPVDSEHSALFHLLEGRASQTVKRLWLTASGGAFRTRPLESFAKIGVEEALKHPTWKMGKKITIDSATMANKGLELIEAVQLFDVEPEKISVVIQPSSQVHSLIQTCEGSFYAQLSNPDMRIPILNALSWPRLLESDLGKLDFEQLNLSFSLPEKERYPLLYLAYEAAKEGFHACIAFNAANEAAVESFCRGEIGYLQIAQVVQSLLETVNPFEMEINTILHQNEIYYKEALRFCQKL